jgi:putative transcriptional regulator
MNSLKGHLLIATPQLNAPLFAKSVILMLHHDEDGAMGVILNRPTDASIAEISEKVFGERFEWDKPLLLGGPVPGPMLVIHADEALADQEIIPGVYRTFDAALIRELVRQEAEPSLVVANCSGWGPGQLEGEFGWDSWLTLPATAEHIFWDGDKDIWEAVVGEVNARKLSEFFGIREVPPDPSVN